MKTTFPLFRNKKKQMKLWHITKKKGARFLYSPKPERIAQRGEKRQKIRISPRSNDLEEFLVFPPAQKTDTAAVANKVEAIQGYYYSGGRKECGVAILLLLP